MNEINSIAALKRVPVGTLFTLYATWLSDCGELREVFKVQTNAIAFKRSGTEKISWLYFAKGDRVKAVANGFVYICKDDEKNQLRYIFT